VTLGLLIRAQRLAENWQGANRPLDITTYTKHYQRRGRRQATLLQGGGYNRSFNGRGYNATFYENSNYQIPEWPVVEDTLVVSQRWVQSTQYQDLDPEGFYLDEMGHLTLVSHQTFQGTFDLRLTYQAGFDPDDSSAAVSDLKYSLGDIVTYLASSVGANILSGVSQQGVAGEFSESYDTSSGITYGLPNHLYLPFVKYRPRGQF
jgi:hypothetical protein